MSINYSPELVRALMQERIAEAQAARLEEEFEGDDRIVVREGLLARLARLASRRSAAQSTANCANC